LNPEVHAFLEKAKESLKSAEADFAGNRYNSCANRCYYACFQAAIAALLKAGMKAPRKGERWKHTVVHGEFIGRLINREKRYNANFRTVLPDTLDLRHIADYRSTTVPMKEAGRALNKTRNFLEAIAKGGN